MQPLNQNSNSPFQSIFEALEERVLFDGVPDAAIVLPADAATDVPAQVESLQQADLDAPRELIVVDPGVENSEALIGEILETYGDSMFEIRLLDADSDGVQQITDLLSDANNKYDAIHIISHGDAGQVNLGNTQLTSDSLSGYADELASWNLALSEDADILFYGCDLASNAEGEQFIQSVSAITGADVAASDDLTGSADKGGDWDLEVSVGAIEARSFEAESWDGVLADKDGDGVDDADDLDDDNDGILDSEEGYSVTTETVDLSTYADGSLQQTFSITPDVDVRLTVTATNGTFFTLNGQTSPFFDPAAGGFAGAADDLALIFDPPNGNPSPVVLEVEFFEAGTTIPVVVNGVSTQVSDIDSSNPSDPDVGRRDRVTVNAFQGGPTGTSQSVNLAVVDPANTTLSVSGNVATALDDDAAASFNDDDGSITVTTGPVDSLVFLYDEITGSVNPAPRGIGILGNFSVDVPVVRDTDGDGVADHCDLDSDNDGISDLVESGADASVVDIDGDGVYDNTTGAGAQVDANGVPTAANGGVAPVDSDGDGLADYLDLDSDNDGIPDTIEAFPTAGYTTNDGNVTNDDTDGDGVLDVFDTTPGHGANFTTPENTDGADNPDYIDTDSDNDGLLDITESGLTPGADNNGDGIGDGVNASYADPDGDVDVPSNDLDNEGGDTSEVAYREVIADLVTVKTLISGDSTPDEGDTVVFQIEVTNDGGADATGVSLTDSLPTGITLTGSTVSQGTYNAGSGLWNIGAIVDGGSAVITLTGTVDVGQGGNTITNTTSAATGDQDDPSTVGDDLIESVTVNDAADLVTVKSLFSADATPNEGDSVTFLIEVTNDGAAQATNVSLTDTLPTGITYTADTTSQGTYNSATGVWTIGTLNDGATATIMLTGTIDVGQGGSTITNATTAATGDQIDPSTIGDDLTEAVVVDNTTDLVTVKTLASSDSTPEEGDAVTFQIEVTNNGAAQATNVSLTDSLPTGITLTSSSPSQGTYSAATGLWTIGTLNDGAIATITLTGTVDVGEGGSTITNITTAAIGDQPDNSTVGDDLVETVVIDNTTDLVTVKTLASSDSTPDEGDTVVFQIVVTNNGGAQATNVSLSDSIPAGITLTGSSPTQGTYNAGTGLWTIGTLNDGASATITLTGTVDVGEGGNTITNVTSAAIGDQPDPSTVGDDLVESVTVNGGANLVTVKTLASGDATPDEGDTVTFQIQVTNNGTAQATNVSLSDSLPTGITLTGNLPSQGTYNAATGLWTIGTLNNGAIATITLTGTVDVGEGGNTITNITTAATADQPDPNTLGDDLVESVTINDAADLVTVKTLASADSTPNEGDTVTFQIEVTNNGTAQATNVSLSDSLPTGITLTGNLPSQGTYNAATGVWTIGTLNNGANAIITLTGTVDVGQGGNTITNVTTAATGDQTDPSTVGDDLVEAVTVDANANLVTVKTLLSGDATPDEGDLVTFQIEVTNTGAAQATNVDLTDLLPAGLTATANNGTISQGTYNSTSGLWDIGTLANGASATLTLRGTVDAGQGGSTITNVTTAATGDQPDPNTVGDDLEEEVVVNNVADLVTVKTLASADSTPDEGDIVTFQIEVTNNGVAQATSVGLTDLLPTGLTATAINGNVTQGSYNSATGLFDIGTLAQGATATLTLQGTVDVGQGGNTITNITSAAAGDQTDPSTVGDDLEETVVVNDFADLVTVKTLASGDSTPDEGDIVTFQIEITNNGLAQATSASLTDLLPAGLTATGFNGTVTQGSYNPATGIFDIGTLNQGASATLTLQGTVDVGQGGNTITNVTTAATGDQTDPSTAGDDLEEEVVVNDAADLVTVKTLASGNSTPNEGDMVTFQIEVTNNGVAQATNVSLTDLLPAGLTATASNGNVSQGSYDSVSGLFNIGTLNQGASATLTLQGIVDAGEGGNTITNVTTAAAGDQFDPSTVGDDLEEEVVVRDFADLVTVKTLASGDSTPDEGDIVTFQIEVTNNGLAQATNVSLTDLLPAGLTATGVNGNVTQGTYNSATGVYDIGTLNQGASVTLTLQGTVDVGQGGNTITNVTTAAAGDQVDPSTVGDDLEEEVVVNDAADLVTVKTLASGDSTPDEGDTVTFQIEVTNNGAAQATSISLTDLLPAGLTATGANGNVSQGSYNAVSGLFDIGTLAQGASATLTLQGTVDVGQGGSTITNVTTAAEGDQFDPSTVGDDLEEEVVVNDFADLVTVKSLTSGDSTPDEGDTVTFQIVITNNGLAQATSVSLTDLLPAGLTATGFNGTVTQGSYDPASGIFNIGTLNQGAMATLTLQGTVDVGQGGSTITNITTAATGDQVDPSTVGDDLEEEVVVNNVADLVTVKTLASGNSTPDEGDTVTFQIEVTNNGVAQATSVSLMDLLPAGLTATGNNGNVTQGSYNPVSGLFDIGTLAQGASATLTLQGIVDVGQGGNTITNVTTAAAGDQTDPSTVGDDLEEAVVVNDFADLVTVKTLASADSTPAEGDTVTFQIEITNNGAAQATNVALTDLLPPGLTATAFNGGVSQGSYDPATGIFTIGTLAPNGVATLTLQGTVDVGQGGSTITNVTTAATGDQTDPSTVGDDLDESVIVEELANLITVKTLASGNSTPAEGEVVTFEIEVTNDGTNTATNVSLTDLLPSGLTATAGNGGITQGTYDAATGLWTIGTLSNGASVTLTLEGTVDVGSGGVTITNVTTAAAGDQPDPTTVGDDLTESVGSVNDADLVTVKTLASGDATPAEGDTVTFEILVSNNGAAQATNVSLSDSLPAGITYTANTVTQGSYNQATGLWTIGTLSNGANATITLTGTVDVGEGGNTITNLTTAATGDQPDPSTAGDDLDETVTVDNAANLVTVKTLTSGDSTPNEGDSVTFQIEVTNNGGARATNVSLTDSLPTGISLTGNVPSQGTYNAATGMWTIGTLNDGASATITLTGTVDVGQGGNTITNVTTAATGDQPDPSTVGDDLTEAVNVNGAADLVTVKTLASGDANPAEGDTVIFQIEVSNNSGTQATNVSLTDQLPSGITYSTNTTTQGAYDSATGVWTIGTINDGTSATITLTGTVDVGQGGNTITNVTTAANGDQPDPSTVGDDLTEAVTVNDAADLVTVKTLTSSDATPAEGDTVSFQIEVSNNGVAQATNVSLTDLLPAGITYTTNVTSQGIYVSSTGLWTIGTLNNGASATITLTGTVDVGEGGNTITNVTTAATGDQVDPSTVGDDLTEAVVVDNTTDLVTVKTLASSDSTPDEGDTVTFQIDVTNNGSAQATNVSLTDLLPSGITYTTGTVTQGTYEATTGLWTIGTLADGAIATITLTGTVDVGEGGNTITNITTAATGDQPDPSTVGDDLSEAVTVNNAADLVTVKTLASGDSTPVQGDTVTFQIQVTNTGAAQATNVSLTDLLPAGLTYTANTTTQGTYDSATGLFSIGTLAVGDSAILTLDGTVDAGQGGMTITNITTAATGDQTDPSTVGDDLDEEIVVAESANLITVKTLASGTSTPAEGDIVIFEIEVTNDGPNTATNVSLTDLLPSGLTATAANGGITQGIYDSGSGLWTIGSLANGASAILTLQGTVDTGSGGVTITNVTTAAVGDQNDPTTVGDDLTESVGSVNDADLVTVKTLASGDATPDEGDTVTFEILVTNNGAAQATNVSLTDLLPAGITYTTNTVTQGTYVSGSGLWTIGTLNSGVSATITLSGTVDVGEGGNTITNITTAATGDQPDPSTAGDDLNEAVTVNNAADLVTVKTLASGDATPEEGDTVTFEILVTNNGAAQATDVSLTDSLPAGITYTGGTVTQGTYDQATGLWTIGTLNNGAAATITLTGTVDVGEGGNTITNITTAATGDQVDPSTVGDDLEEAVVVNDAADLVTVKTLASSDSTPAEGDTVTFDITVANNGGAQATNVSLTDSIPAGFTLTGNTTTQGTYVGGLWTIGTLNAGSTATITLTGTIDAGQGGNTITNVTTAATGDQIDPSTAGDDLEESVVVEDNTTDLVTVKTLASGDSTPDEGDTVTFDITVTNNGTANATNVDLTDLIPSGLTATVNNGGITQGSYDATTGLWTIGSLANGASATLTIEGIVNAGQSGNTITNTTTAATGDQVDPSTVGDDLEETVAVGTPAADLVTVKTLASGDATPDEGDVVTYDITVTNNGPDVATNVSLTDLLPAGLTATGNNGTVDAGGAYNATSGLWTIGTLASGATVTLTLEGTVNVGQGGNTITNITTAATGDQVDPSTVGDDLEESVVVNDAADLVTVKTLASGDATPAEGDTVTFEITVTNNGAAQATNVSLTDSIPTGFTLASNTTTQGTYVGGVWTIGTIDVGATATITLTGTIDAGEAGNTITNVTTAATGDQVDPSTVGDDLEESVVVEVIDNTTDLVTVKTLASGDTTPDEGDTVTFDITVTNNGAANATNVDLTDLIPAGLTATVNNGGITQGSYDAVSGLWTIGSLANGASATLTIEGIVDAGQSGNTITNTTTAATGDQVDPSTVGDDLEETVAVGIPAADLVTVKTLASGDSTPAEGDTVTFDISVTNNGPDPATNVSLTDLLPAGLTATANNGSSILGGAYDDVSGLWTIGTLASGATATLTLEGIVDVGQGGNTITNVTTAAAGDQVDPSTVGDDLEESVAVDAPVVVILEPAIGLAKAASDVAINGDNFDVTFTLTWQNIGNTVLDNVEVFDDVANLFGGQFVGIVPRSVSVTSFSGAGTAPTVNTAFEGDTTQSLITSNGPLEIGDTFEVVFTVTIDPDADFSFDRLDNQATSTGDAVDGSGDPITDALGNQLTAFDDSDNGVDPTTENGEDNGDGTFANDVTPVQIADIGVAKSIASDPEVLFNGNSVVTFQVVVQNTGNVDLESLSLVEDLATQFAAAFVSTSNLTLTAGPTDPGSSITLDSAGFNGSTAAELLDQTVNNSLAIGDSFTLQFTVEVDPAGTSGTLENQVAGNGDGVDQNGDPIFDSSGNQITADDLSDSGTDPGGVNADQADDNGTTDDPSLFTPTQRSLSQISGTVFNDLNNDGIQDANEPGIAGVEVTLIGEDVYGNSVLLTAFTDANGVYTFDGLNAGTYSVFQRQPEGFDDGIESSDVAGTIADNQLNDITIGFNQNFSNNSFGEVQQQIDNITGTINGTSGSPARLPPIIGVGRPLNNMFSNFLGGPGPVYSGIPIASNGNPLTLQSNRPVSGGYSSGFASPVDVGGVDCNCPEVIEAPFCSTL